MTTATNVEPGSGMPGWVGPTVQRLRLARAPIDARQALGALAASALDVHLFFGERDGQLRCLDGAVLGVAEHTLLSTTLDVAPGSWLWGALQGRARSGCLPPDPCIDRLFEALQVPRPKVVIVEPVRHGATIVGVFLGAQNSGAVDVATASGTRRALAAAGRLLAMVDGPPQTNAGPIARTAPANPKMQQFFESTPDFEPIEANSAARLRADAALKTSVEVQFESLEGVQDVPGLVDLARSTPTPRPVDITASDATLARRQIRVQITPTSMGPVRRLTPRPSGGGPVARRVHLTPTPVPPSLAPARVVSVAPPNSGPLMATSDTLGALTPPPGPRPGGSQILAALENLDHAEPALNASASELLLRAGPKGLEALIGAFPGHLRLDRYSADSARQPATEHSHVIAAIIRFGASAAESLTQLSDHLSPEIRYYAVLTLGALGEQAALGRVATARLLDKDSSVREVTQHVLNRLRAQPVFEDVVGQLRRALVNDRPARQRSAAEALGMLRAVDAWRELLKTLPSPNAALSETVHRALCHITWQDYGRDVWKWQAWFDRHRNQPRVEWLLDGMMNDQRVIRAGAFRELLRLTRQNYGYMVDAPPAERRLAVEKWLKWWNGTGRGRFAAYR